MSRLSAVLLLCLLPGCAFVPGLVGVGASNATWPVDRATGENPLLSGQPLRQGYEPETKCDAPFVGGGAVLSVEGDQLCLTRRLLTTTPGRQTTPPMLRGAMMELVTEQGRSDNLSMPAAPATFLGQCMVGVQKENLWGGERRVCVPNTVLKRDTRKVTVRELINVSWVDVIEWTVTAGVPTAAR